MIPTLIGVAGSLLIPRLATPERRFHVLIGLLVAAAPGGAAMDRFGPRRTLFVATMVIVASGLLRASAESYGFLLFAVAIFGLGGPLISVGAPKVIALWFEGKDRAFAMGVYITGPSLGMISGLAFTNPVLMPLFDQVGAFRSSGSACD